MVRHHAVVGRYVTIDVDDCEYKVRYLQYGKGTKLTQKEKWTKPLMFYRKYELNNFNWTVLSDYLKPRIPIADFSGQNIKDALQDLATVMNYEFGIRNGEPFFEPSYKLFLPQTFYYEYLKNDGKLKTKNGIE